MALCKSGAFGVSTLERPKERAGLGVSYDVGSESDPHP